MYGNWHPELEDLILLVMQNRAKEAIDLIESGGFDANMMNDIGICKSDLPLYKLSLCNDILLSTDDWREDFQPIVDRNRLGCKDLLDYWKNRWKYPTDIPLDFGEYEDACAHFDGWDIEDLFDVNMNELKALGYDENEVEFCHAVLNYNSDLIQKHINMRTNPDIYISGTIPADKAGRADDDSYNALVCCNTFYCDAFDCYCLADLWSHIPIQQIREQEVRMLLEAAAYCDLEKKLKGLK
ncbi:MAG: hypothetical protein J6K38_02500 [Alistipes sp.]|nr:hypothetical protein [Alistipes sp.]MBP3455112.1 hypothetical protein [Alistipes sp.]